MAHSARVRRKSGESVVGPSAELPGADIPTVRNILAYGELLKERVPKTYNEVSTLDLSKELCSAFKVVLENVNPQLVTPGVIMEDRNIVSKIKSESDIMKQVNRKRAKKKDKENS